MKRALLLSSMILVLFACKKEENYNANTATTDTTASATATTATGTTGTTTGTTGAPGSATATLNDKDKGFVEKAGKGGKAETALAQDAVAHATNPDVKSFAQKLVDDHSNANTQLAQLASTKGVTIPSEMEVKATKAKERLEKLTGKSFDEAFVKQMVEDHKDTIKLFEEASKSATDNDVKSFATSTLPTLQQHLKMAEDLEKKVKK